MLECSVPLIVRHPHFDSIVPTVTAKSAATPFVSSNAAASDLALAVTVAVSSARAFFRVLTVASSVAILMLAADVWCESEEGGRGGGGGGGG